MSYQVLARKWRPKRFREMAGQEHVLQAIINGLDHDRLHHAYLFTGTRGVGKTTIARIFAKCLNCESGVSSEPCGSCTSCTEINENRFIDLIEVDAASRTKVEDTRELLENVQYAPSKGRYKVYLIDEVHMLSNSSFNALLKTLEEPPPHVKFLLATTDPQKLPATVLSRCLQFNLKNLSPERIVQHLKDVLQQEMVQFDEPALWLLGRAANGSMRDALSLTDQAIAFGSGKVLEGEVATMLGTIDTSYIVTMLQALASNDAAALLASVDHMSEHSPDYQAALEAMLLLLHRITVAQMVPAAVDNAQGDREQVLALAEQLAAGDVQLFYQLGLHARRDLPLAPDPRSGFEMAMLRMMAFKPQTAEVANARNISALPSQGGSPEVKKPNPVSSAAAVLAEPQSAPPSDTPPVPDIPAPVANATPETQAFSAAAILQDIVQQEQEQEQAAPAEPAVEPEPLAAAMPVDEPVARATEFYTAADEPVVEEALEPEPEPEPAPVDIPKTPLTPSAALADVTPQSWPMLYGQLDLSGVAKSVISHCALERVEGQEFHFVLEQRNAGLFNEAYTTKLQESLARLCGAALQLTIDIGEPTMQTPAQYMQAQAEARQAEAERLIHADPNIQMLMQRFDASIIPESIEPMTSEEKA
mgnify:CR=1 FL=1